MRWPFLVAATGALCVLVPLFGAAPTASASSPFTPKVVGGHAGDGSESDFVMALGYKTNFLVNGMDEAHFCGGALVAPDKVLTAAHCVVKTPASNLVVASAPADGNLSSVTEAYTVRDVAVHPQYDKETSAYDVAVITLNTQVDIGTPVPVVTTPDAPYLEGTAAKVMGWGAVDFEGKTYPDSLVVGDLSLVSDANCGSETMFTTASGQFYGWGDLFASSTMVCAAGVDGSGAIVDACNGDSGGPLVGPGPVLLGVVSWGSMKCGFPAPGVYARVGALTEFLAGQGVPVPGVDPPPAPELVVSLVAARALPGGQAAFRVSLTGASWESTSGFVQCVSRALPPRRTPLSTSGTARVRGLVPGKSYTCRAVVTHEGVVERSTSVTVRARR